MELGAGFGVRVDSAALVALGILGGLAAFLVAEAVEPHRRWPPCPGSCPSPVQQVIPADLCRASMPPPCCPAPSPVLG